MKITTGFFQGSFAVEFLLLILLSIFNPALALAMVTGVVYLMLSPKEEITQGHLEKFKLHSSGQSSRTIFEKS